MKAAAIQGPGNRAENWEMVYQKETTTTTTATTFIYTTKKVKDKVIH